MVANISKQLARLPSFSRQQLLDLWKELHGRDAPRGIRRELMVPFLAYQMQVRAYGGLKPSTRSELRRIARNLEKQSGPTELRIRPRMRPGTRLVRRWRQETHEVVVTNSEYEYRGAKYKSLSKIAREITGTRWSGPAFFGLNAARYALGRRDE
jgi:hypothetical protein